MKYIGFLLHVIVFYVIALLLNKAGYNVIWVLPLACVLGVAEGMNNYN